VVPFYSKNHALNQLFCKKRILNKKYEISNSKQQNIFIDKNNNNHINIITRARIYTFFLQFKKYLDKLQVQLIVNSSKIQNFILHIFGVSFDLSDISVFKYAAVTFVGVEKFYEV
jgi:hypothetical protein